MCIGPILLQRALGLKGKQGDDDNQNIGPDVDRFRDDVNRVRSGQQPSGCSGQPEFHQRCLGRCPRLSFTNTLTVRVGSAKQGNQTFKVNDMLHWACDACIRSTGVNPQLLSGWDPTSEEAMKAQSLAVRRVASKQKIQGFSKLADAAKGGVATFVVCVNPLEGVNMRGSAEWQAAELELPDEARALRAAVNAVAKKVLQLRLGAKTQPHAADPGAAGSGPAPPPLQQL